jgi:hypothetical protein
MSPTPKKLPPDSEVLRVFHLSTEYGLKFVDAGKVVWSHFRLAHKALIEQKGRLQVHQGLAKSALEPRLYVLFVRSIYMKKNSTTQGGAWELTRGAPVSKLVDEEEMIILRTELALEMGKTS